MARPDFPRTLAEFQSRFVTEDDCRRYLVECRWPDGYQCPRCAHAEAYELSRRELLLLSYNDLGKYPQAGIPEMEEPSVERLIRAACDVAETALCGIDEKLVASLQNGGALGVHVLITPSVEIIVMLDPDPDDDREPIELVHLAINDPPVLQ